MYRTTEEEAIILSQNLREVFTEEIIFAASWRSVTLEKQARPGDSPVCCVRQLECSAGGGQRHGKAARLAYEGRPVYHTKTFGVYSDSSWESLESCNKGRGIIEFTVLKVCCSRREETGLARLSEMKQGDRALGNSAWGLKAWQKGEGGGGGWREGWL